MTAAVLWRRLDSPGHDACRLVEDDDGWAIAGTAVFRHEDKVAQLAYQVGCDRQWRSRRGEVRGWIGGETVAFTVVRTAEGVWTVNGSVVAGLEGCTDLDIGFTPSTNLLALRRLNLQEGEAGDSAAAWLDVVAGTLQPLPQRYERRSQTTYWYEAPFFGYSGLLEVAPTGFIRHYPELWEAEP